MTSNLVKAQELAKMNHARCFPNKYHSQSSNFDWECCNGHTWTASYSQMKQKFHCKHCAKIKRNHAKTLLANELAAARGGKCLNTYEHSHIRLSWECEKGHKWDALLGPIRSGSWCPTCVQTAPKKPSPTRKTIEQMREIAKERNGECLSVEYENNLKRLHWRCEKQHEWFAAYNDIRKGHWCPECRKNSLEDAQKLAILRKGKCLSIRYENSWQKMSWECEFGHQWEATYSSIKNGSWCPHCAGVAKYSIQEVQGIAALKGGKCLSEEYKNALSNLTWECAKGHVWNAQFSHVKRGSWCRKCFSESRKVKIEDIKALAKSKNGECLSEVYVDKNTPLLWRCDKGHEWSTRYKNIKHGHWCPTCATIKNKLKN